MGKQLVLVGAGHAHLATFVNLHRFVHAGHQVLVVSPHPHYTYSGMGPGVLSGIYTPEQGRIHIQRLVPLLLTNLGAALKGKALRSFRPRSVYTLMFNLGDGTALYIRGGLSWTGRLAFALKNRIDRRFMETHRAAELTL